jgi:hypothetical protein
MVSGRRLRFTLIISFIASLFFTSCQKNNDKSLVPCYLEIDSIGLVANQSLSNVEGSLSNNITDAWVYVDQDLIGAFELPAHFPVLKEGRHTLYVNAGIKVDGIAGTRTAYPFYKAYSKEIDFVSDSTIVISPTVQYDDKTVFEWVEDFESGHSSLVRSSRSDTIVNVTSDPADVFEGNYSGIIHLDDAHTLFEALTRDAYVLPQDGSPVYLEMNFKTDIYVTTGVFANESEQTLQQSVCVLNTTQQWKKIYIDLTNAVDLYYLTAIDYKVFIGAEYDETGSNPVILIDNLKLLH